MKQRETCEAFANLAARQYDLAASRPSSFLVGAMLAGGFVGMAEILALSVGAHLDVSVRPLMMGAVFGISILLTIFGGGELFNGQAMFASLGVLHRRVSATQAMRLLAFSWFGNLLGVICVCALFALGGGGHIYGSSTLLHDLVTAKVQSAPGALLARAILCNWLACLGIWTAGRLKSEAAKMIVLAWCVMAYVACGLEHTIADMALFAIGLMAPVPVGDLWSVASAVLFVSLGNLVGGAVLVGGAYRLYSRGEAASAERLAGRAADLNVPHLAPAVQASLAEVAQGGLRAAA